jgi:alpha-ribazole phosphatase/probable phosphoglycerate mutase
MTGTTLVLIRHAQIDEDNGSGTPLLCGWCDAGLSEAGRRQVERLRSRLREEPPPAAVYCSTLLRACETARAAEELGFQPRLLHSLREIHCGSLDGTPLHEVQARHPDLWQRNLEQWDEAFRWPGGESYRRFRSRALRAIRAIAARHAGDRVWIFTHTGVISQVLGQMNGNSPARWDACRPSTASLTEVRWEGCRGSLVRFNDRRHLEVNQLRRQ